MKKKVKNNKLINSKKNTKYLKIIILRAQFASNHSTLVVSLKYIIDFFFLSTQMSGATR